MAEKLSSSLGFIRYDGDLVKDGVLDARASATALLGFDKSLRYFIGRYDPSMAAADFQVPVKIEHGSWIATIPEAVGAWVVASAGLAATAYITSAAAALAGNDFKDKGVKDVFRSAIEGIQWTIRLGKHLGSMGIRRFQNTRWRSENTDIGISNENGEVLYVPQKYFSAVINAPSFLLSDIASVVEMERDLSVVVVADGVLSSEAITFRERHIFYVEDSNSEDVLFPELVHGAFVSLDGLVTRGNEVSNSIGFRYNEHILACYPSSGSIVRFKRHLFSQCRITGTVSRVDDKGRTDAPRPKIIFDTLELLGESDGEKTLFDGLE